MVNLLDNFRICRSIGDVADKGEHGVENSHQKTVRRHSVNSFAADAVGRLDGQM